MARRAALSIAGAALLAASGAAGEPFGFFKRPGLAAELTRIYNERDVAALQALLAPDLRDLYPPARLAEVLALCRALTHDIQRLGPPTFPSMNARHYGFLAAEAETGMFDLVIEIDPDSRIVHLVLSDDLASPVQQCRIGRTAPDGQGTGQPGEPGAPVPPR